MVSRWVLIVSSFNFYLFSEFEFWDHLIRANSCAVFLYKLSVVARFVDHLFVTDIRDFSNF